MKNTNSIPVTIGAECRCYPFQGQLVLPFLPKSGTERVISSGLDDQGTKADQSLEGMHTNYT